MEAEAVAVISASDTIPVKESVGVAVILSEKVAVIVTTFEFDTILSESVSVRVTVVFILEETIKNPLNVAEAVPAVLLAVSV